MCIRDSLYPVTGYNVSRLTIYNVSRQPGYIVVALPLGSVGTMQGALPGGTATTMYPGCLDTLYTVNLDTLCPVTGYKIRFDFPDCFVEFSPCFYDFLGVHGTPYNSMPATVHLDLACPVLL